MDQVYSNTRVTTQVNTSPTRVKTNQHNSDTSQHKLNMGPTRINSSQRGFDTSQQESIRRRNYHAIDRLNRSIDILWESTSMDIRKVYSLSWFSW